MPAGDKTDVLTGWSWVVEIDGISSAFFKECSGLSSEHDVIEVKTTDGKGHEISRKTPGRLKWGDVTLKRGATSNMDMWQWRQLVQEGKIDDARKNGSVVLYDYDRGEVARWNFVNGWPSKYSAPSLNSENSGALDEELTIVHEGIERIK